MENVNELTYVNYIAVISMKQSHLHYKLNSLQACAEKYQLRISANKAKAMQVHTSHNESTFRNNKPIIIVHGLKFLGSQNPQSVGPKRRLN